MCTFSTMHHGKTVKRNATQCTFIDLLEGNAPNIRDFEVVSGSMKNSNNTVVADNLKKIE